MTGTTPSQTTAESQARPLSRLVRTDLRREELTSIQARQTPRREYLKGRHHLLRARTSRPTASAESRKSEQRILAETDAELKKLRLAAGGYAPKTTFCNYKSISIKECLREICATIDDDFALKPWSVWQPASPDGHAFLLLPTDDPDRVTIYFGMLSPGSHGALFSTAGAFMATEEIELKAFGFEFDLYWSAISVTGRGHTSRLTIKANPVVDLWRNDGSSARISPWSEHTDLVRSITRGTLNTYDYVPEGGDVWHPALASDWVSSQPTIRTLRQGERLVFSFDLSIDKSLPDEWCSDISRIDGLRGRAIVRYRTCSTEWKRVRDEARAAIGILGSQRKLW